MSEKDPLVVFTPSGKRGRFPVGTQLLEAARTLGVDVDSVCGGRALCGRCQVLVMEGDFPKHGVSSHAANLTPLSAAEEGYAQPLTIPPNVAYADRFAAAAADARRAGRGLWGACR